MAQRWEFMPIAGTGNSCGGDGGPRRRFEDAPVSLEADVPEESNIDHVPVMGLVVVGFAWR